MKKRVLIYALSLGLGLSGCALFSKSPDKAAVGLLREKHLKYQSLFTSYIDKDASLGVPARDALKAEIQAELDLIDSLLK